MKILLLTDEMQPGGVPRHVCDLANGLNERGITPIVAATDGPFRSRLSKGIRFVDIGLLQPGTFRKRPAGFFTAYWRLSKLLQSETINLLHSHKRYSDLLGRLLTGRFHIPHTSTCHNIFKHSILFSHFPHSIVAPSTAVADSLRQYYGTRREIKLINLGIRPLRIYSKEEIVQSRNTMGIGPETAIIASVGQLIPSKDRETLLHAAVELRQLIPEKKFVLLIVGDGEQRKGLTALSKIFKAEDIVRFLPASENVEMVFNLCSFGVLSSLREGMPYVLLEAASLGKPHVATNAGGVTDFISHESTGLVVPQKRPRELASSMARLLLNPDEAVHMGANARTRFENGFSFDRLLDETINHYSSLLKQVS